MCGHSLFWKYIVRKNCLTWSKSQLYIKYGKCSPGSINSHTTLIQNSFQVWMAPEVLYFYKDWKKLIIFIFRQLMMMSWVKMFTALCWSFPSQPCQRFSSLMENSHLLQKKWTETLTRLPWNFFLHMASFFTHAKSELCFPGFPWCLNSLTSSHVCLITHS